MSIVKCVVMNCPFYTRSGYGKSAYAALVKTERGTERADGLRCWRCREHRYAHLKPVKNLLPVKPGARR